MLGAEVGTYLTTAAILGIEDAPEPAVFTTIGVAARLAFTVAPPATAASGVPLSPQPVLQLQDAGGSDIAREEWWSPRRSPPGAAAWSGTSSTSDVGGRVAFADLAIRGSPGTRRLIFAADGFASATGSVSLDVGAPASIEATAGSEQAAAVATAVATRPAVVVRDEDGNLLGGIPVTFKVTGGGGSLDGANPVTGSDGVAIVGGWTLGKKVGANTLEATLRARRERQSGGVHRHGHARSGHRREEPGERRARDHHGIGRIEPKYHHGDRPRRVRQPYPRPRRDPVGQRYGEHADPAGDPDREQWIDYGSAERDYPRQPRGLRHDRGTAVTQTASIAVSPGAPSATRSSATVPDGTAGKGTTIEIRLRDAQGNDLPGQASAIAVSVSGANSRGSVSASDHGGGRYTAAYTPEKAGTDQVQVRVSGTAVPTLRLQARCRRGMPTRDRRRRWYLPVSSPPTSRQGSRSRPSTRSATG